MNLKALINEFPDFPKKGILFRDFGPILRNPQAVSLALDEFAKYFHPKSFDLLAGIESRGFILACAMSMRYSKGMIMMRKAGKLPGKKLKSSYSTEYGKDSMEIQKGAIGEGERVLICDDLLATGGTAAASARLVEKSGGTVAGFAFFIELADLGGKKRIEKYAMRSLVKY